MVLGTGPPASWAIQVHSEGAHGGTHRDAGIGAFVCICLGCFFTTKDSPAKPVIFPDCRDLYFYSHCILQPGGAFVLQRALADLPPASGKKLILGRGETTYHLVKNLG